MIRVGLIGRGIQKSQSPALHEAEAAAQGLAYRYELVDLDLLSGEAATLPAILDRLRAEGFVGSNVTHPVKQTIIPLLDRLSPEAEAMGAVNTLRFADDGAREGHNTDWWGFGENFRRTLPEARLDRVALLGAGGAGSAAAYALARLGAGQVTIVDADEATAAALAGRLAGLGFAADVAPVAALAERVAQATGLVHATPVGMLKYPGLPIDPAWLRPELWVAEIVYVPLATELLRAARARGCATVDGGGMVVLQAARAFEIFTGLAPDVDRMLRHFRTMND